MRCLKRPDRAAGLAGLLLSGATLASPTPASLLPESPADDWRTAAVGTAEIVLPGFGPLHVTGQRIDLSARTLNGFAYVERTTGAPVLAQSVAFLDCEVRDRMVVGNHTFFAGEVVDCGFLKDEAAPVLSMSDTRMNYGG